MKPAGPVEVYDGLEAPWVPVEEELVIYEGVGVALGHDLLMR